MIFSSLVFKLVFTFILIMFHIFYFRKRDSGNMLIKVFYLILPMVSTLFLPSLARKTISKLRLASYEPYLINNSLIEGAEKLADIIEDYFSKSSRMYDRKTVLEILDYVNNEASAKHGNNEALATLSRIIELPEVDLIFLDMKDYQYKTLSRISLSPEAETEGVFIDMMLQAQRNLKRPVRSMRIMGAVQLEKAFKHFYENIKRFSDLNPYD